MKTRIQLAAILLIATLAAAQTPVVPGSILGSLTPITTANGTLNAVFPVVINTGAPAVLVQLDQTTTITAGAIRFQVSYDGTNYVNVSSDAVTDPTSATNATIGMPYTLQASTNKSFAVTMKGAQALQILVSTAMTGTGAITAYYSALPTLPAFGLQLFSLIGVGGTVITNVPTAIGTKGSGIVMSVNSDLTSIAGTSAANGGQAGTISVGGKTATNTVVSGDTNPVQVAGSDYGGTPSKQVLKVDSSGKGYVAISGSTGTALDASGALMAGGKVQAPGLTSGANTASLTLNQTGALSTQGGGAAYQIWNATTFTGFLNGTSNTIQTGSPLGTLNLAFSGITGSPSGCSANGNVGPNINIGASTLLFWQSASLGSLSTTTWTLPVYNNAGIAAATLANSAAMGAITFQLSCSVYPSGGTVTGTFIPSQAVNIAGVSGYGLTVNSAGALSAGLYDAAGNGLTSDSTTYSSKFALDGNLLGTLGTAFSTAGKVDVKSASGDLKMSDASGNGLTSNSTTYTAKFGLDSNLLGTLGTAFSTAGKVDVKSADGDLATLGAKADAKSTATDTTAVTIMSVLKEISALEQAPASQAVTNAGTFAVQDTLQAGTAIAGKFGIDQTTPGTTNAMEMVPDTSSSVALTTAVKLTVTSSVSVKASAGNVYGVSANNGAAAVCWVQFTNSAGAGTLGSAVIFSVVMPASGTVNIPPGALALANFSTGITVGIASVTNSSSACGTAGNVTVFYK